jgi:hypothetical protein
MKHDRLSYSGWGPLLETKNGPIPRTESQKLGWHGTQGADGVSKPLVPARHAVRCFVFVSLRACLFSPASLLSH